MPIVMVTSALGPMARTGSVAVTTLPTPIEKAALTRALVTALRARSRPPVNEPSEPLAVPAHERLHLLLAEDNLVNQRVAQLMLVKLGHTVDTVDDGAAAYDAIRTTRYDSELLDVNMPQMNGIEATRRIRSAIPALHQPYIIALTADATERNRLACQAAGMDDHLIKPVHIKQLRTALSHPSLSAATPRPAARPAQSPGP